MISILYIFLYGRVGGVSRGGCAYPDIQITGRLYHFFWKLPNFSFRQFFWNSCYNLYLHQYQNPTKSHWWRGLRYTFAIFKHCGWVRIVILPLGYSSNSKGAQTYFIRCWRFSLFFLFICAHVHELHTSHKRYTMCKRCILLKFFILGEKAIENPSSSNDTIKGFLRKRLSLKSTF